MSSPNPSVIPINILLVDDDPGDVLLTKKALTNGKVYNSLTVAENGVEALQILRREGQYKEAPFPDLILLDLNMPKMDGRETLAELKADDDLKRIPVVVLTTSDSERDIADIYDLQASCFITKPVDLPQFTKAVQSIRDFWLCFVKYPSNE
jgi:two-component system response regulator